MVRFVFYASAIAVSVAIAACSSSGTVPSPQAGAPSETVPMQSSQVQTASGTPSVLAMLTREQTIGSAVNPVNGDVNPYGLDVAKITAGKIQAGDLVVCDFNNRSNIQGTGKSILVLHPVVGSKPVSIAGYGDLTGCDALALAPSGPIWAAAFSANDNPITSPSGQHLTSLPQFSWHRPFGEAFAPPINSISVPAFYVSNASDGSLVRVYVFPGPSFRFATIVTGFPVNHGVPGSILAPSGLNYQRSGDILYVVDGTNNALYAIHNISRIFSNGITVHGLTFSGPQASAAKVVFAGAPLNGPISSAILPGGNIAVGNTLDPNGKNLIVEITPLGSVVHVSNVDTGAAGALFGMVATGTSPADAKLYFNDDNDNTTKVLSH